MALTLIESAKIALGRDQALKATVMELYAKSSDIMQYMPFENISGNSLAFNREKTLPNAGFRGVNEGYTEGTGELEKVIETLAIAGGDLDVDKMLIKTGNADQQSVQEGMKIKALSLAMTKEIIKGDVGATPKGFDGLQIRLVSNQKVDAGTGSNNVPLSLVKLDEVIDTVEDPSHLLMNKTMRRLLTAASRSATIGGYITYEQDAFGRRITQYAELPILIADKDNVNTDIMPFTEAGSGTTVECTSIYCISFMENGVVGLQNGDMEVTDLGEIDTKPVFRTRVEWYITLGILRPKSAARLFSIRNASVTANVT